MKLFRKMRLGIITRSVLSIVGMLLVLAVTTLIIGYYGVTDALMKRYSEDAFWAAHAASMYIEPDLMDEYMVRNGDNAYHKSVTRRLQEACDAMGVTFIYVIQPDITDFGHIKFLFTIKNYRSPYELYDVGYVRETTNDDYRQKYRQLYEGTVDRAIVVRDKGYISTDPHLTVMIPLITETGEVKGILCVQVQMDALYNSRHSFVRGVIASLAIITLICITLQSYSISKRLLIPVKEITEEASRFAKESVRKGRLRDKIKNSDEIGVLADSIDNMEEQIQNYVSNITKITEERQRITTELTLAAKIQSDSLPNDFPAFPDKNEFDIYATMTPAKEVGGDFYDFFLIDEDHLYIVIADVSGKGVPAALFMMSSKNILGTNALKSLSPSEILENSNNAICNKNREDMFVTAWVGILELSTGKLTAANAGHEYPYIRHADGEFELYKDKHGMLLGEFAGIKYEEYTIQMKRGSKLFVYTDGLPEATDKNMHMFGMDRVAQVLERESSEKPETVLENVQVAVDDFLGDAEQFDDLTMLCLEFKK